MTRCMLDTVVWVLCIQRFVLLICKNPQCLHSILTVHTRSVRREHLNQSKYLIKKAKTTFKQRAIRFQRRIYIHCTFKATLKSESTWISIDKWINFPLGECFLLDRGWLSDSFILNLSNIINDFCLLCGRKSWTNIDICVSCLSNVFYL